MGMRKCVGALLVLLLAVSIPMMAADSLAVSINGGDAYTNARAISVELAYQGIKMPTEMRVNVAGEDDWSDWVAYADALDVLLPAGDGRKVVRIETRYWVESKTATTVYGGWHVVLGEDGIFLDMTPPTLTASLTPDASEYGWYNGPVSVVFQASDQGSGIVESPRDVRFNQEGVDQSIIVKAIDGAGNETVLSVDGINIDMTSPTLTVARTPVANADGWNNTPVTVAFEASDALSGIVSPLANIVLAQEGSGQLAVGKVVDKAGNETEITVDGINIDMTSPIITVARPPANADGWYDGPVAVTYNVVDALSGIAFVVDDRTFSTTSDVTLFPKATDKAGNVTTFGSLTIQIDVDDPSIVISDVTPGASPDVWSAGPVTVTTAISDGFSGVESVVYVEGAEIFASNGGGQIFSALVTDLAGNQATATVGSINIDSTLPTTTILLKASEGLVGASADGALSDTLDLTGKLDAYGEYDPSSVALAYAFQDSSGMPIEGLKVHATILKVGEGSSPDEFVSLLLCDYAPTGGFYYMVLPETLVSGQEYVVWFEAANDQANSFKARIIGI